MKATRRHCIEGREVRVYDGLLPLQDIHSMTAGLQGAPFTRTESARPDTSAFRHWVMNIPMEAATQLPVYQPTLTAAGECAAETAYKIYRCYCNYAAYGDMLFIHTDCPPGAGELTALWFIAPEWNVEWGGETVFFDSSMDAQVVVSPRPGRLVLFDGALPHAGRPPNRICFAPRYTLAYKLQPLKRPSAG
ncbi:MAG TPA: 2OG-Fe(II) oxygenase [Steroidobacteraceae bacterium]|nr:2OG-Fe(II) oxygenase [Steroidobacteraceae bacterium]